MSTSQFKLSSFIKNLSISQPDFNSEFFISKINILISKFPDIPGEKINQIIRSFFEIYYNENDKVKSDDVEIKQQKSICNFIANVIEQNLGFNDKLAFAIACRLIFATNYNNLDVNTVTVTPIELQKVTDNIIGIEVIYKRTLSSRDWERITNIYMKSIDNTKEYSQTIRLTWDLLPLDVKDAFLDLKQNEQRFILYPLNNKEE